MQDVINHATTANFPSFRSPLVFGVLVMKSITIVVAGSARQRQFKGITILRGATPRDIQRAMPELRECDLCKPAGGQFNSRDDLYAALRDGAEVYAVESRGPIE